MNNSFICAIILDSDNQKFHGINLGTVVIIQNWVYIKLQSVCRSHCIEIYFIYQQSLSFQPFFTGFLLLPLLTCSIQIHKQHQIYRVYCKCPLIVFKPLLLNIQPFCRTSPQCTVNKIIHFKIADPSVQQQNMYMSFVIYKYSCRVHAINLFLCQYSISESKEILQI